MHFNAYTIFTRWTYVINLRQINRFNEMLNSRIQKSRTWMPKLVMPKQKMNRFDWSESKHIWFRIEGSRRGQCGRWWKGICPIFIQPFVEDPPWRQILDWEFFSIKITECIIWKYNLCTDKRLDARSGTLSILLNLKLCVNV